MGDSYDHLFKILLVGDSGVGKSCLLMRFTADRFDDVTTSTIGVDFRVKYVTLAGRRVKLTVWDTAGQERFRTLTSSYYRGAQGIVFAYDVTRRDTFENVERIWMKEVELYSNVEDAVKMVVANKVDLVGGAEGEAGAGAGAAAGGGAGGEGGGGAGAAAAREVSSEEGHALARANGCLFVETSAKANIAVGQAFEELVLKILETPGLADGGGNVPSPGGGVRVGGTAGPASASTGACPGGCAS